MAGLEAAFFDTSVLVAGVVDLGEVSRAPRRLLNAVADGAIERPLTAWHCCLELFSVTTRLPEEYRVAPEGAYRLLQEDVFALFEVHALPSAAREAFFDSVVAERLVGGRVYDAHIGEVALRAGARIVVTDNRRHFTSLLRHGVRVLTSEELVAELPI